MTREVVNTVDESVIVIANLCTTIFCSGCIALTGISIQSGDIASAFMYAIASLITGYMLYWFNTSIYDHIQKIEEIDNE
jgi:hypothetical protein